MRGFTVYCCVLPGSFNRVHLVISRLYTYNNYYNRCSIPVLSSSSWMYRKSFSFVPVKCIPFYIILLLVYNNYFFPTGVK